MKNAITKPNQLNILDRMAANSKKVSIDDFSNIAENK